MPLDEYRSKRDFSQTPEPAGDEPAAGERLRFVVHKHKARRQHYDLRLELDGVLKCWAVPKGPCLDPADKRLAVHTEDHPFQYIDFEGVIPEGSYGAGGMIVWDTGTWFAEDDPAESLAAGLIKFYLEGRKLHGRWMLVRLTPSPEERTENWLLVKERDEHVQPLVDYDILKAQPHSVVSGKTVQQIARDPNAIRADWLDPAPLPTSAWSTEVAAVEPGEYQPLPRFIEPQLAKTSDRVPTGERWLHEIKFDGYRLLCRIDDGEVALFTRTGQNWTERFAHLAEVAAELPVHSAWLDGEIVALKPNGASNFAELITRLRAGREASLVFFAFDLLYLDGVDLRDRPLEERKESLKEVLSGVGSQSIQYADHLDGHGKEFFRQCCQTGLEGIISKRRDRPYRSGRTDTWLKSKCVQRDEFVIGGFTEPEGQRQGLGAIIVGFYDESGHFTFAGKVGTGFDDRTLLELRGRLDGLAQAACPFYALDRKRIEKDMRWVQPLLVSQIEYANWTVDGLLWHPVFQGLREDVAPQSVGRPGTLEPPDVAEAPAGDRASNAHSPPHSLEQLAHIRMTNPDKVMYPQPRVTKFDLARYYVEIADWVLPQVTGRPLSLVRCPDGLGGKQFFQKHGTTTIPKAIQRIQIDDKQGLELVDLAGLVSLVQIGTLEIHLWQARSDRIDRPDRVVFDLDPAEDVAWPQVVECAFHIRGMLDELGLENFVKTSGGKGVHIFVPIRRRSTWSDVKSFARGVAETIAGRHHRRYTASSSKKVRKGKVYIDYLRTTRGATVAAAYSTRNREGAPVSMPVAWDELGGLTGATQFDVTNVRQRLLHLDVDPWADIDAVGEQQSLTAKMLKAARA